MRGLSGEATKSGCAPDEVVPLAMAVKDLPGLTPAILRRLYTRCFEIYAPSESMAAVLTDQRMSRRVRIWSRGIDRDLFNPGRRDLGWRRSFGIADGDGPVAARQKIAGGGPA